MTVGRALTEKAQNMKRRTIQFTEWCEAACGAGAPENLVRCVHRAPMRVSTHACGEVLKIWSSCSDSTTKQGGDIIWSEDLCEGHRESAFINFSDNEPPTLALKDAAARSSSFVDSVLASGW